MRPTTLQPKSEQRRTPLSAPTRNAALSRSIARGRSHVAMRMQQLGDDMLLDGITYPTFVDSLLEDERLLKPDNLTQLREEYDAKLALPAPGRKEIEAGWHPHPLLA